MNSLLRGTALVTMLFAGNSIAFAESGVATATTKVYQSQSTSGSIMGSMQVGQSVDGECFGNGWCLISVIDPYTGVRGWVRDTTVSLTPAPAQPQPQPQPQRPQPQPPNPPLFPWPKPTPQPPVHVSAGACFYSERNYAGSSFCVDDGDSYSRLRNWDNRIRSVEVFGGARVDLCSDANFYGSCTTLRSSTSRLPSSIDRRVTSLEVY